MTKSASFELSLDKAFEKCFIFSRCFIIGTKTLFVWDFMTSGAHKLVFVFQQRLKNCHSTIFSALDFNGFEPLYDAFKTFLCPQHTPLLSFTAQLSNGDHKISRYIEQEQ